MKRRKLIISQLSKVSPTLEWSSRKALDNHSRVGGVVSKLRRRFLSLKRLISN